MLNIYFTYIISISMGGVVVVKRLKLNRTQIYNIIWLLFLYTKKKHKYLFTLRMNAFITV